MNADERNPALIIFWLITIGYITSTICEEILGTFYFLREELALQHQLHQLQAEKNNISTTELSRRGRLERKEISVRQEWQRLRQLRLRYTVSLSSILFIFDVAPCEIPCSIFGRVASSYIPRGKRLNVVEHLGLLLTYNATSMASWCLFALPIGWYMSTINISQKIIMLPVTPFESIISSGGNGYYLCSAWVWAAMCIVGVQFARRMVPPPQPFKPGLSLHK